MWLINSALRRPVTILIAVLAVALCSALALRRMPVDIFPNLNLPVIYVAQPYGGMDPAQMESFLVSYYEYHFLYVAGIEHVESKSIQNVGLVKLFFHPGTDMSQALAQTIAYVERSRAFMPPGTVSPFVVRFDAGSVPVGQLVFSSETRSVAEIQDLALFRVRPVFSTLPGVSAPPPFGGNQRTVVIRVDPERLRSYGMSTEEVVKAVASGNTILPAGNVRIGDLNRLAPVNSVVGNIQELAALPIRAGAGATVYVRDVGTVENSSDILTGYGLVNNRRTVYIPVTKRSDASTLDVVNRVRSELPRFQSLVPEDIRVSFEFDQSVYVTNALRGLTLEGVLGAVLTGLVVLLFLRDLRSAVIVVATIPFALLAAVTGLWLAGQTINVMTLGGLALAIGILVDEATVAIENIHAHLARGEPVARAVLEATHETITPRLLAMLAILAVFVPSFFMVGATRALFVPLSLAVGFAMFASYVLSNTLVPVLAARWLGRKTSHDEPAFFARIEGRYRRLAARIMGRRALVLALYAALSIGLLLLLGPRLGADIFPEVETGLFQLRLRAPTGTRVEKTETIALRALDAISEEAGAGNVAITLGFVGTQPASYPVNTIHLWTSGPQEAVLLVALRRDSGIRIADLKERLRRKLPEVIPDTSLSFEAGDVVSQIMNFGAPTPIEVAMSGPNLAANREFAERVLAQMKNIPALRDLQFGQPLDYPTLEIRIDRERAGQLGVTVEQIGRSLVAATSSSRFTQPVYWRDPASGVAYQVQVEIPQSRMNSIEEVASIPAMPGAGAHGPFLRDVAEIGFGTMPGEYDRYNQQRMVTITGNIAGSDLGSAANEVNAAIARAGDPPRGVAINVRGQAPQLQNTIEGLGLGLGLAIVVIILLLAANFQSLRLAGVVLTAAPAVLAGVALALWMTATTLNVQSFMGAIMAIGVSSANAILLVTFAEARRRAGMEALDAAIEGARSRLRPILMTSMAMIAGMLPMAFAVGEGGEQTAPLGRAVIGGLAASTFAVLLVLPAVFAVAQRNAGRASASLHPDDLEKREMEIRREAEKAGEQQTQEVHT
ncbi:MAG: efflux RND transporter permease subunit [Acidobacteria bacterium]|nr:efflux RND transporter permease subunit [Acidobacteriota bacterium]MCW5968072.1 efflux RND transporter permease subunit [Blastocatellales bacterium]